MNTKEISVKREFFLTCLFIEDMISKHIQEIYSSLLNQENLERQGLFSTFNEKIDYLMDVGNFSIIDNSKLSVFKEIRAEFLKSDESETLEDSFISEDNNDDFLLILYPQADFLPRNEKLTVACYNLINEVSQLVAGFTEKSEIKFEPQNSMRNRVRNHAGRLSRMAMFFTFFLFK